MEPPAGVEPALCTYRAHTLRSVDGERWCRLVVSIHVLQFFRLALNDLTSSAGEDGASDGDRTRCFSFTKRAIYLQIITGMVRAQGFEP